MGKLTELMADVLRMREDEITDDLSIDDTENWDSLRHMELIVTIEETFGIKLTADEIVAMVNIEAIQRILNGKGVDF